MRRRFHTIVHAAAVGLAFATAPIAINSDMPALSRRPLIPVAYSLYCLDHLDECRESPPARIEYTSEVSGLLQRVNRDVNRSIQPVEERSDVWSLEPEAGDCDDYVMTKRSRLIKAGIPLGALRVAVVLTPSGAGHAVLIVNTSDGDLVLDNIRKTIVRREEAAYHILSLT